GTEQVTAPKTRLTQGDRARNGLCPAHYARSEDGRTERDGQCLRIPRGGRSGRTVLRLHSWPDDRRREGGTSKGACCGRGCCRFGGDRSCEESRRAGPCLRYPRGVS